MNWSSLTESFLQIWDKKPMLILLLLFGFIVFVCVVLDVRCHKRRKRNRR